MSAWIVSKAHIDALVWALGKREMLEAPADEVGQALWEENYRSINYRYSHHGVKVCPTYTYEVPPVKWTAQQLTDIVGCYDYQTCEHPEWQESESFRLVQELMNSILREGADRDARSDAPWGLPECGQNHGSWEDCEQCSAIVAEMGASA